MMKKDKKQKKENIDPLSIITLVFAILSSVTLGLAAAHLFTMSIASEILKLVIGAFKAPLGFDIGVVISWFISSVFSLMMPMLFVVLVLVAAVLLALKRNGVAFFVPFGLLSILSCEAVLSLPLQNLYNFIKEKLIYQTNLIKITVEQLTLLDSSFTTIILPTAFVLLGFMITVIIFVPAAIWEKFRFIPMIVLHLVLCVGAVAHFISALVMIIRGWGHYTDILNSISDGSGAVLTDLPFNYVLFGGVYVLLAVASLLAIFALLPYKTKKEPETLNNSFDKKTDADDSVKNIT